MQIVFQNDDRTLSAVERDEALALIRQLMGEVERRLPGLADVLHVKPLPGGRSTAKVLKLTFGERDGSGLALVVKIASVEEGKAEKQRFEAFARDLLPEMSRPELLAFTYAGEHAALCFTFVGGPNGGGAATLTDHLQRGNAAAVDLVIERLFPIVRDHWYAPELLRSESDLAARYLDRHFKGRVGGGVAQAETTLFDLASRYLGGREVGGRWKIDGEWFPSPVEALFGPPLQRTYRSCILHGDLNSDNILVTGGFPIMVDFRKAGRGHVYEDLVALEASMRINYRCRERQDGVLETERRIAYGNAGACDDPYSRTIMKIRDLAASCFGDRAVGVDYHFAVAAIGLRLMHAVDLEATAHARIAASTILAGKVVEAGVPS